MNLLGTEAYRNSLSDTINNAKKCLIVISAFVTRGGCEWINQHIENPDITVQFIVRWKLHDLLAGASDLASYEYATAHGWTFCVQPDLHSKVILADERVIHLGSANVTNKGLALTPGGNRELGISFLASQRDLDVIKAMRAECTLITPEIFLAVKRYIDELPVDTDPIGIELEWPAQLKEKFIQLPQKLWVADLLWAQPPVGDIVMEPSANVAQELVHDLKLLGLPITNDYSNERNVLSAFKSSRSYLWLISQLNQHNGQLFFGELTALLHESLLDDPAPYRKDVKGLVSNLLSWIEALKIDDLVVDIPGRFSQRLRLVPKSDRYQ